MRMSPLGSLQIVIINRYHPGSAIDSTIQEPNWGHFFIIIPAILPLMATLIVTMFSQLFFESM